MGQAHHKQEAKCLQIKFWSFVYLHSDFVLCSNCCYQANKQRFEVVLFIDVSLGSHSQSVLSEFSYWAQAAAIICICVFSSFFCQTLWPEWPGISGWGISPEFAVDERQWYTRYPRSHVYCKWRSFWAGVQDSSFPWQCILLLDKHLFGQKKKCPSMLLWTCILKIPAGETNVEI